MNDREKNILEAAVRAFSRFGVKRTSMNDLSDEAGISRQTLYKAFRNKDEVLCALIRYYSDLAVEAIELGLPKSDDLADQLDVIFNERIISSFDLVAATPNAEDIIDGFNASGKKELEEASERFAILIEGVLTPHEAQLNQAGINITDFANFIQRSGKSMIFSSGDRNELLKQVSTLKQLCLAVCRSS